MAGRSRIAGGLIALATVAAVAASLAFGSADLALADVALALFGIGDEPRVQAVVVGLRLPRALLAVIVGAALATSGAVFQGIFRNPLADPFVVGVSSGAALGAVIAIVRGATNSALGSAAVLLAALAGGLATAFVVTLLARVRGHVSLAALLLAGFALGSFATGLVSLLLLLNSKSWQDIVLWSFGNLDRADAWLRVGLAGPLILGALVVAFSFSRDLDLLALGDEQAQQLGVAVERSKWVLIAAATILAAAAVACAGIIGFVGLIVPHVVRRLIGPLHGALLPAVAASGGAFLLVADIGARLMPRTGGLPVGTVTALLGAPFFLALLRKNPGGS